MFFRFYWTSPSEQAASPWERALGRLPSHFDRTLYNRSLCFAGVETYLTGSEKLWQPVIQVMPQRARHSDHGLRSVFPTRRSPQNHRPQIGGPRYGGAKSVSNVSSVSPYAARSAMLKRR